MSVFARGKLKDLSTNMYERKLLTIAVQVNSRKYLFDHGMYERRNGKLQENSAASQVISIYIHFQFGGCSQHTHQLQVSTGFPHAQRDLTVEAQRTFKTSCL